ncbi:MAG: DUF6588 family protein, partial [Candidatus Marinimicrobia bacterium]|nr:DUF6588 family protein [Candidatus Neomarinimicrobiota bacterium]
MKKSKILIILFLIVFSFGILEAGSFEDALTGMLENNAEMYAQPLVTGFGTAMNSGLYKRAKTKTGLLPIPIGIDVGVVFGGALVSEDDLNFNYEFMDRDLDIDLQSIDASLSNVTLSMSELYTADKDETPTA